ncbi:hypothetical protein L0E83_09845 [Marichromatium gracile]|uniref:Holin n=1 Tax=Marichromatium gracile TaxID=1048 RepID=A0ABR5VFZ0_MARGR|nr:hypothetical protein [Marichromatium gracile]KXX64032.1 hypothetical protein AY586_14990 [Marichromatium gracile]MCF1183737.1 hypothetical protein [Marichromatium gracile]
MDQPTLAKPWWRSRAVIGALVVVLAQVASAAGVTLDSAALTDALVELISLAGAGVAIWGRVRASVPLRLR